MIQERLTTLMERRGCEYRLVAKDELKIKFGSDIQQYPGWIRAVMLESAGKPRMAILPSDRLLDFNLLARFCGGNMVTLDYERANRLLQGVVPGLRVPVPSLFKLPGFVDSSVAGMEQVYFEVGDGEFVVVTDGASLERLCHDCKVASFSVPRDVLALAKDEQAANLPISHFTPLRIKSRIEDIADLPALPGMALEILKLQGDRYATAQDLAVVLKKDPSLAVQVMSLANSAFYGYRGKIDSIETAITRVLGFDMVINLSLGIVLGKTLKAPIDGPLGLRSYWRQAVVCASLSERFCLRMTVARRPVRGLVYLSGLLHNIGHLLLAHAFPPQYFIISRFVEVNPHIEVSEIEQYVLGVSHEQIGSWLLKSWKLPEEIIEATRWHHQEEYASRFATYSNLVYLSNRIIAGGNYSDARSGSIPESVLQSLGLSRQEVETAWQAMDDFLPELEAIAEQIAA